MTDFIFPKIQSNEKQFRVDTPTEIELDEIELERTVFGNTYFYMYIIR